MLIIGFILLVVGADLLVKGSSNIAKKFHIPEMLIGLTIVALGTSMPELIITITSASHSSTDLIMGNAIGSNLCNLLFILGLVAVLRPVKIEQETKRIHVPVSLLSTVAILGMGVGTWGSQKGVISRTDGIILVLLYFLYFLYPIVVGIKDISNSIKENKEKHIKTKSALLSIVYIILGIILLRYGGDLVVNEATEIAIKYGISERVIGLTIVAIGTALPELITSIIATIKKEENLAMGNLIGSCILNILLILGTGAIIIPLSFSIDFMHNLILLAITTILIWAFCFIGRKNTISRFEGLVLLVLFAGYMVSLFR